MTRKDVLRELMDAQAPESDNWKRKNLYYYESIERIMRFHIPPGSSVLEIGCGTGDLLAALEPSRGVGVDISPKAVEIARAKHPRLTFLAGDAEELPVSEPFDYVILSDLIGYLDDVQRAFEQMNKACGPRTRVILTYFNYLWAPVLRIGERLGMKRPQPEQNWLALPDLQNLLSLAGFQTISMGYKVLLPVRIPLLSSLCNRVAGEPAAAAQALPRGGDHRPPRAGPDPGENSFLLGGGPRAERAGEHRGRGAADPGDGEAHRDRLRRGELPRRDGGGDRAGDRSAPGAGREDSSARGTAWARGTRSARGSRPPPGMS